MNPQLSLESLAPGKAREYRRPSMADVERVSWNGLTAAGSFSGCGGSSLGLRMAGWRVPYAIEFVDAAADSYLMNAPGTVLDRRDVRKIEAAEILGALGLERGELDLFEGSPPCAAFSVAGSRERTWGEEKDYSEAGKQRVDDLFWEWARLLGGLRPRAFLAENVPGMLVGNALERYARRIVRDLADLGYRVRAEVLNACWYGVPQDRRRLIFMGLRRDVADAADVGGPEPPPPTTDPPFTLREALTAAGPPPPGDVEEASMERFAVGRTWRTIAEARRNGREVNFRHLACQRCGAELHHHPEYETRTSGAIVKATCADGEPAEILKDYFSLVVPDPDRPCPTVTATGASAGAASVVHPFECRKFVPEELKAICGFPADFRVTGTFAQRCERFGRAVCPPMYEAVGRRLAEYLGTAE